jgi:hypothetical protein
MLTFSNTAVNTYTLTLLLYFYTETSGGDGCDKTRLGQPDKSAVAQRALETVTPVD